MTTRKEGLPTEVWGVLLLVSFSLIFWWGYTLGHKAGYKSCWDSFQGPYYKLITPRLHKEQADETQ